MKCFIGLGSNLGDRRENLERAAKALVAISQNRFIRVSPIYETPALVPDGAPEEWRRPYFNAAAEIDWSGSAIDLLRKLKDIERELGRSEAPRWAPRPIDLDLLLFGDEILQEQVRVPHPEILRRSFVLDPLKDLCPLLRIPGAREAAVIEARKLNTHAPWVMAIVNLTPDSFSDGGELQTLQAVEEKMDLIEQSGAQAIDIGAESTRPNAQSITPQEERHRLEPVLELLREKRRGVYFKPWLSVDTRNAETAALALSYGADCINDVSGLQDPRMLDLLASSSCDYVLMHSLSVPVNPKDTLPPDCDPVSELKGWLNAKLELLDSKKIDLGRIIFDPGIGFGKTAAQSVSVLQRMHEFAEFPVRILVGHSRKSFLKSFGLEKRSARDASTLALSLELARKGVDILRVHDFESHVAAFKVEMELKQ